MTLRRMLAEGAQMLEIPLSEQQTDAFLVYLVELEKWNRKINLTSIRDEQGIIVKHFLDSLSYLKGFTPDAGTALLDIGSGAGFPALPLKIACPDLSVTLVEAVNKKASFLRHILRTLNIQGAEVAAKRTEQLPVSFHARFAVVTARAFASMEKALFESSRFLAHGGSVVLSRGPDEMIESALAERCGFLIETVERFALPFLNEQRAIWVFRKLD